MGIRVDILSTFPLSAGNISKNRIYPVSIKNSIIGKCSIGEGSKLSNCYCLGEINIGKFVSIFGPGTVISAVIGKIEIGSYSSIGQNVMIQESYHNYMNNTSYLIMKNIFRDNEISDFVSNGNIIIEEDVWIGSNSVILSGVRIGRGAIVGAGSVVTKDLEKYTIYAGNPAKKIRSRFNPDRILMLEKSNWWMWSTEELLSRKDFFNSDSENDAN